MSATPPSVAQGSGTHVAAENLAAGVRARGHPVSVIRPARPPRPGRHVLDRLAFNARLRSADLPACDLLCGLDLDGWLLAPQVPVPYVTYLHGVLADEARFERGVSRWSLTAQAWAEGRAARRAARVLVTSAYSAGEVARLYGVVPDRIHVVHPGIDVSRWRRRLAAVAADRPTRPGPVILSVGRMYPRKNQASLIRAAAALSPAFPELRVHLVGDGPERARLARLTATLGLTNTVRFLGQTSFPDLVAAYAACDVFCLPTLQEGFGIVFAEAMLAGKPVVAVAAGATPEVVVQGETGLLTRDGDDRALVDALASLLRDPARCQRLGTAGRERAERRFGLDRTADRFLEAVLPLVQG